MNILIVDDQPNILSSLKTNIHWRGIGIANVYTASSAFEAKSILTQSPIDILLTDIEMPVENGIMLLQWARTQNFDFECIFLTSHSDFQYLRSAMNLDACDYVLQPARFEEIEASVCKAVEKRRLALSQTELIKLGQYAFESRDEYMRGIFLDWIQGKSIDIPARMRDLKQYGIQMTDKTPLYPVALHIFSWQEPPRVISTMLDPIWKIFDHIFSYLSLSALPFSIDNSNILILLYPGENGLKELLDASQMERYFQGAIEKISSEYACSFTLYTGGPIFPEELASAYAAISKSISGQISFGQEDPFELPPCEVRLIDLRHPAGFQTAHASYDTVFDQVIQYIRAHLNEPVTCADIAASLYLSPDYVTRIIREKEGKTLKKLLMELKMEEAKRLLDYTDMPIGDIAMRLGFSSSSHFSSAYRATYHQTPREYRK